MAFEERAVRRVLFAYRAWQLKDTEWVLSANEEVREAFLLDEPFVRVRSALRSEDRWPPRSAVADERLIVNDERRYAVVPGTGEFTDFDAVRAFYETYLRARITEWVEQDGAAAPARTQPADA